MSVALRRRSGASADGLDRRLTALREAAELARGRASDDAVGAADAVIARAGARLGLGVEATVVALAGPTGAGKSTLFNALAGDDIVAAGRRRPTTSTATAALWGTPPDALLDGLEVPRRHRVADEDRPPLRAQGPLSLPAEGPRSLPAEGPRSLPAEGPPGIAGPAS